MNFTTIINLIINSFIKIDNIYITLTALSFVILIILKIINKIVLKIYNIKKHKSKRKFKFTQRVNMFFNIICIMSIFVIWEPHLKNVVTILSFLSAGAAIALREVILNLFAGVYIKWNRPFVIEDRIEIDEIIGDVVLISTLSFKVLEVRNDGHQSSGKIINIPNSWIFSKELKNYTTAFKYIWTEMTIPIKIDADIDKNKKILESIVSNNEIIKAIPKKMDKAIDVAQQNYRIYYNNLTPIIYTNFNENHIDLIIRYLVHPKKERTVEDELWNEIINNYKEKKLDLYINE